MSWKGFACFCVVLLSLSCCNVLGSTFSLPQTSTSIQPNLQNPQITEHLATAADIAKLQSQEGICTIDESPNQDGLEPDAHPPTAEEWATIAPNAYIVDSITPLATLPSNVDNSQTQWFPPIGNQGHGCNAFSVGYYTKTFMEAKEHGWDLSGAKWQGQTGGNVGYPTPSYQDKIMSPAFIYNLNDPSGSIESTIGVVCNIGVCTWKTMPYVAANYTLWPPEQAWIEAAYYRGNSTAGYQYIDLTTDAGLANLKAWLSSQNLASFLVDGGHKLAKSNFDSNDVLTWDHYQNAVTDHVNTIVGYNDNIAYTEDGQTHYGAFKIANSWGVGGWENVADGYYWISYEAMKQGIKNCLFYYDLVGYHPDLSASFKIEHNKRSDCTITLGLGSTSQPTATKQFSQIVSSYPYPYSQNDYLPFPDNNIVVDITEFENHFSSIYNQTFWLSVSDSASTATTGVIVNFAVNSSLGYEPSTEAPCPTINSLKVTVSVRFPEQTAMMILPTAGAAGQEVKFLGTGFAPSGTANLSYQNPINNQSYLIEDNISISASGTLSYTAAAPDLTRAIDAGANTPSSDTIIFHIQDNLGNNFYGQFLELKRGLLRVGDSLTLGESLYGNQTDLTSCVAVNTGQSLRIVGCWFQPGNLRVLWDNTVVGNYAEAVDGDGGFTIMVPVPATNNGSHIVTLENGDTNFTISINANTIPIAPLFTLCNGVLYSAVHGTINAYQANSGAPLWNTTTNVNVNCLAADSNALYIGSAEGVFALDLASKTTLWSTSASYYKNAFALTVTNGLVYVSTKDDYFMAVKATNGQSMGGDTGYYGTLPTCNANANGVIYLGLQDGRLRAYTMPATAYWQQNTYSSQASWSSFALDNGLLFASSANKIYAFNASNGNTAWTSTITGAGNSSITTISGQLYVGLGTKIYSLSENNGNVAWSSDTGGTVSSLIPALNGLCFISGNQIEAMNLSGSVLWTYPIGAVSTLALDSNTAYVSSLDGNINAVDVTSGQKVWDLLGYTLPSPTPTPPPTPTPTVTPSPSPTPSPTPTPPPTPTPSPSTTPTPTASPTHTTNPTATPKPTESPTSSVSPTPVISATPEATALPIEGQFNVVYAVAGGAIVLGAIGAFFVLKKRRQ